MTDLVIRRIPAIAGGPMSEAAQLAMQAWPEAERAGQLLALESLCAAGRSESIVICEARDGSRLVAAVMAQVLAGRSAAIWPPQATDDRCAQALLGHLHTALAESGVHLAQALLESRSGEKADALVRAGYQHAGDLLYMVANASDFPAIAPKLPFVLQPAEAGPRLERLIAATYQGSLDCPLVDGLRETADILAGYREVGRFSPELWLIATQDGADVGCLLLADHSETSQYEIVYMGIAPPARGRGYGLLLARYAQWLAHQVGRQQLVLAVDAANKPAISGYAAANFRTFDQRSAFVKTLRGFAK